MTATALVLDLIEINVMKTITGQVFYVNWQNRIHLKVHMLWGHKGPLCEPPGPTIAFTMFLSFQKLCFYDFEGYVDV